MRPWPGIAALLALAAPAGARAQPAPQLGPALAQAGAGMQAAQAALAALAGDPAAARAAAGDAAVKQALAALQAQAASLEQAVQRLQEAGAAPGAAPAGPLAACRAANAKLLQIGHDILHLYETQSFRSLLLRSYEPALGLYRVELENMVQDTEDKLRENEVYPDPGAARP